MIKKTNIRAGILLLWALLAAGCAGGAKQQQEEPPQVLEVEEEDIWYVLSSVDGLNGEWEALKKLDVPADESRGIPRTFLNVRLTVVCTQQLAIQRVKIEFGDFLRDMLATHPSSRLKIDDLWAYFENSYAGYILIKEQYALVIDSRLQEQLKNNRVYINQTGSRLRVFLGGGLLESFGIFEDIEFILRRS
jgi:hypothetical protein